MFKNSDPLALEEFLNKNLLGQEQAAKRFAHGIMREVELHHEDRPRGTFLFLGPTGVGKTEMTQQTARYLYGEAWKEHFYRIDMAEFQTQDSLDALLGKDMDSRQGSLGEAIDRINAIGGGMILFDEIEKASQELNKVFYGILDAARVSMRNGETKSLVNFYLVATSNLGTEKAVQMEHAPYTTVERTVLRAAEKYFGSPLFYRFRERIVFKRLSRDIQFSLADKMFADEVSHIEARLGIKVEAVDATIRPFLIKRGYNDKAGARPMRDAIHNLLCDAVLECRRAAPGGGRTMRITVDATGGRLRAVWCDEGAPDASPILNEAVEASAHFDGGLRAALIEDGFTELQVDQILLRFEQFTPGGLDDSKLRANLQR